MSRRYHARRRRTSFGTHPFIGFLLIASFGILFAGCSGPEDFEGEDLVFTDDDVARYRELAAEADGSGENEDAGSGSISPSIAPLASGSGRLNADSVTVDLSQVDAYASMRMGAANATGLYQVTNDFLNVRDTPSTGGGNVARLEFGDSVEVVEFVNAQWAKVKASGVEGFVSQRYLAKVTSEERLEDEKEQFKNMYYVNYGFVNMRAQADVGSEKIGEIPGQTIIRPSSIDGDWAKVSYDGKEGYVSTDFIAPFLPSFIVRQETYDLPVLHYRLTRDRQNETLQALGEHVAALRAEGYVFITFAEFRELLQAQQRRDVRLEPKRVIVAVSGVTPENDRAVSAALNTSGINATLFIETRHIGLSGITEKRLLTLMANGFDIQSGTHTGDDMRALTNAQVELELKQSRQILEDYTKKDVFAIGYPQGGVNDRVAQLAAEAGYLFGLGDEADRSFTRGQFLRIPAMVAFSSMSSDEVVRFVEGGEGGDE